jgi:hypothetical protein
MRNIITSLPIVYQQFVDKIGREPKENEFVCKFYDLDGNVLLALDVASVEYAVVESDLYREAFATIENDGRIFSPYFYISPIED